MSPHPMPKFLWGESLEVYRDKGESVNSRFGHSRFSHLVFLFHNKQQGTVTPDAPVPLTLGNVPMLQIYYLVGITLNTIVAENPPGTTKGCILLLLQFLPRPPVSVHSPSLDLALSPALSPQAPVLAPLLNLLTLQSSLHGDTSLPRSRVWLNCPQ